MSLSCECGDFDADYFFMIGEEERIACTDYVCYGCGSQGHEGDRVRRYTEEHHADEDELRAMGYGDFEIEDLIDEGEINVVEKTRRLCATCGDMHDNLVELGFCFSASPGFIKSAMHEYRTEYAGPPLKKAG